MGKRQYKRIPKKDRRNQKLWAEGCRETILLPHVEKYADSMRFGWTAERDYFNRICNEYHTLISWRLSDDEEPDLPLPVYDINEPPVVEDLTAEEQVARGDYIRQKNKAIRRWLQYRVQRMKKIAMAKRVNFKDDPLALLMAKLSGIKAPPQKRRQGYQQYMHECQKEEIHSTVVERWAEHVAANPSISGNPTTAFRCKIAKELYDTLPEERKASFVAKAEADRDQANAEYKLAMSTPPSQAPADRQRCINRLGAFFTPIFEGVKDFTGMHLVVLVGGCMPDQGGEIGSLTITRSVNKSPNPVTFAGWQPERFQRGVSALFEGYLQTCFTSEDKAAAALPPDDPLLQAKYRMDVDGQDDDVVLDDSDSDGKSSSDDDDDDDDAVDSEEEAAKMRSKKRRRMQAGDKADAGTGRKMTTKSTTVAMVKTTATKKSKSTSQASTSHAIPSQSTPQPKPAISEYERIRNANLARNQLLLDELDIRHAADIISGKRNVSEDAAPPRPKPRRKQATAPIEPLRRSTRGSKNPQSMEDGEEMGSGANGDDAMLLNDGDAPENQGDEMGEPVDTMGGPHNNGDRSQGEVETVVGGIDVTGMDVDTGAEGIQTTSRSPSPDVRTSCSTRGTRASAPIDEPASSDVRIPRLASGNHAVPGSPNSRPGVRDPRVEIGNHSSLSSETPPPSDVRNFGVDSGTTIDPETSDAEVSSAPNVENAPASDGVSVPPPNVSDSTAVDGETSSSPGEDVRNPPSSSRPHLDSRDKNSAGEDIDTEVPDNAPNWLKLPVALLMVNDLGKPFRGLLSLLISLEVCNGFKNGKRGFPKVGRPAQLTVWIVDGRGRSGASTLVTDTISFGKTWRAWWISLQPKWRRLNNSSDWPSEVEEYGDEWDTLDCPGANGFLGVVACLYWWGCSVQGKVDGVKVTGPVLDWEEAVIDVGWVLQGILAWKVRKLM